MTITDRLAALAAKPATHNVVVTYMDGRKRIIGCRSAAAAQNHASGEARKIGRELISRDTGATVKIVSVEVEQAA